MILISSISNLTTNEKSQLNTFEFLQALYKDIDTGCITLSVFQEDKHYQSIHVPVKELYKAANIIKNLSSNSNVYFGVGVRKEGLSSYQRGSKQDVISIPALFLEIDISGGQHQKSALPTEEEAMSVLNTFSLYPNLINHSGGGLHVYYMLEEPFIIENEKQREEIGNLLKRLENVIHALLERQGKVADSVAELARVLRPAGTFNHKYSPVKEVKTIHHEEQRYSLEEITEAIEEFEDMLQIEKQETKLNMNVEAKSPKLTNAEVLQKAFHAKNGDRIKRLYEGDISTYESHSEADLALCNYLSYYTQNPNQLDRLFINSALYRPEKWDREDYKTSTIQKAINGRTSFYQQGKGSFQLYVEEKQSNPKLVLTKQNTVKKLLSNLKEILLYEPKLKGIGFNEFTQEVTINGDPITDDFITEVRLSVDSKYHVTFTKDDVIGMIGSIAREKNLYHPIKRMIDSKKWDGKSRVEKLFIDYIGAEDNSYIRSVAKKWLAGAVARIYEPGIKMEIVPILQGKQGIGKSTLASKLGGEYFVDSLASLGNTKDDYQLLIGSWIIELGELTSLNSTNTEKVKSFISARFDKIRLPYGKIPQKYYRTAVFIGTTNTEQFLNDLTGNRRFFPIVSRNEPSKDVFSLENDTIQQIWAEAYQIYKNGETLYLDNELDEELAEHYRNQATEENLLFINIDDYLDMKVPDYWDSKSMSYKRWYFDRFQRNGTTEGIRKIHKTTAKEIAYILEVEANDRNSKSQMKKINLYMDNKAGWEKKPVYIDGKTQRGFMRSK